MFNLIRAVDLITGDSGHPNYERAPSFKDPIGHYLLAKTGSGISLCIRRNQSWISRLRLMNQKRETQSS
uniref:Uncharacterized protein n=1 Tax=Utricularia reniformis TaxID=192314 RepID=A0A1Y0AZW1_9LAMI|nr:hypothetical protein AEK19_MT0455 [Utricularia reniformis]ART30715.1 hypothetical protein AEK19_MT0455 [Utricularia reniformis]